MADVVIVSANYGAIDPVHPQAEQDVETDWVYVSDAPIVVPAPWKVSPQPSDLPPRMAAKLPKFHPPEGYRYRIWINASYEITSPSFVREALESLHDGIAVYRHPFRNCIYQEAIASFESKYDSEPIQAQVDHYRREGHPENWGLWELGMVVWDWDNPKAKQVADAWLEEVERWSIQDQLSFPAVCRRLGAIPGVFDHGLEGQPAITGSRLLKVHSHL